MRPPINPFYRKHLSEMFHEASNKISTLLVDLNCLYSHYAANFDVADQYQVLLRVLLPVELLVRNRVVDPASIINLGLKDTYLHRPSTADMGFTCIFKKNQEKQKIQQEKLMSKGYILSDMILERGKVSKHSEHRHPKPTHTNKGIPQQPKPRITLNQCQQQQIQEYLRDQVSNGAILTMQDIADYTRKLAIRKGKSSFLASLGWVKNFMKRYPEMRELYAISRLSKNRSRFPDAVILQNRDSQYHSQKDKGL